MNIFSSSDYYDDECPITLEPLKDLPYPPFLLASSNRTKHYFDGAALATYIVAQGAFTNPLTREPLKYEDCVLLDEYLDEYVFNGHNYSQSQRISVREAWSLRESIKVKVTSSGDGYDENQRRREEVLRNEASVALRGLFVFGHERRRRNQNDNNSYDPETLDSQTLPRTVGGFNLYHNPDSSLAHSWGLGSTSNQEGLLIIDDDEAAHEAADVAAWREVQDEFPTLGETRTTPTLPTSCDQNDDMPSQILATVRHTAELVIKEEKEKEEAAEKARQRYFLEALERKRRRIDARRKAKGEIAKVLVDDKKAEAVKLSARDEIDRWLSQKWNEWETHSLEIKTKQKTNDCAVSTADEPYDMESSQKCSPTLQKNELTEEEKAAKAAAKKKAKRQKAKERAKEKKQIEKLEREKKERAMALRKEKESSSIKCAHCGEGVLGFGYDKFDKKYCSTKCARSGSK